MPTPYPSSTINDAVDCYHDALASSFEVVKAHQEQRFAVLGLDLPRNAPLRPTFVDRELEAQLFSAASAVAEAIFHLTERLLTDRDLRDLIGFPRHMAAWLEMDREHGTMPTMARLDGMLRPDGSVAFLEMNPFPGGITDVRDLDALFLDAPGLKPFAQQFDVTVQHTPDHCVEALRDAAASMGRASPVRVGRVRTQPQMAPNPQDRWLPYAASLGVDVLVDDAAAFHFDNGELKVAGQRIDLVILPPLGAVLRSPTDHRGIMAALASGAARAMYGVSRQVLCGKKGLFPLLSDPVHSGLFPSRLIPALRRHVPWSRLVRDERSTDPSGASVDLLAFVANHRQTLVLKSFHGGGGKGVLLGLETDEPTWQTALSEAVGGHWIVQERVDAPRIAMPYVSDGRLEMKPVVFDLSPYVWNGRRAAGAIARVSPTAYTNVSLGGSPSAFWTVHR